MRRECSPKQIDVAVGLIRNEAGEWLCCQRRDTDDHGGLWEFPGGKFELGESLTQALVRELQEELDLVIGGVALECTVDGAVFGEMDGSEMDGSINGSVDGSVDGAMDGVEKGAVEDRVTLRLDGLSIAAYMDFAWQHPGKAVYLYCGLIQLPGVPNMRLRVHQSACWLPTAELASLDWLASNRPIIDRIQTDFR